MLVGRLGVMLIVTMSKMNWAIPVCDENSDIRSIAKSCAQQVRYDNNKCTYSMYDIYIYIERERDVCMCIYIYI